MVLSADRADDVHLDQVAELGRAVHHLVLGLRRPCFFESFVDVGFGRLRRRGLDPQIAVLAELDGRAQGHHQLKLDVGIDLDILERRLAVGLELVPVEHLRVDFLPDVIHDFAQQRRLAVQAYDVGERRLARAETGDFRLSRNDLDCALERLLRAFRSQLDRQVKLMIFPRVRGDFQFFGQRNTSANI